MISIDDVPVSAIYPPYQVDDFQRCPYLWDVQRRWQPRKRSAALLSSGVLGSAVAAGLKAYYSPDIDDDPVAIAERYAEQHWEDGMGLRVEGLIELARRATKRGMQTDLGLSEILAVEKRFGRFIPDLIGRHPNGALVVIDHKVKKSLDDAYKERTLLDFNTSNQFLSYAWAVGQEFGEPVVTVYAHLIVLSPRVYTELHPVPIEQEHLAVWLQSAAVDWREMAKIEKEGGFARRRFSACNGRYGLCEFYQGCHTLNGVETFYGRIYDTKQRGW